eukprot:403361218
MSDSRNLKKGGMEPMLSETMMDTNSVMQYQNKALASLCINYKQEIANMRNIIQNQEKEAELWNKSFSNFALALQKANNEIGSLLAQQASQAGVQAKDLESDPLKLQQYIVDKQSSLYKNLINLIFLPNQIYESSSSLSHQEMEDISTSQIQTSSQQMKQGGEEESKISAGEMKLKDASESLNQAFVSAMQRYIQVLRLSELQGILLLLINSYQFQGNKEVGQLNQSNQHLNQQSHENLLSQLSQLKQKTDELNRRISEKNAYMARLEEQKKELDTQNSSLLSRINSIQKELKKSKEQVERINLRTIRGAPYIQIIQEFFPDQVSKFVEPNHTCVCSQCLKELNQNLLVPQSSTEQSSVPNQLEEQKNDNSMPSHNNDIKSSASKGGETSKVDQALLNERDEKIADLENTLTSLKIQNKELFSRIDKMKSQAEISEDKFSNTQLYKLLVTQCQSLAEQLSKHQQDAQKFRDLKGTYQSVKSQKDLLESQQKAEIKKLSDQNESLKKQVSDLQQTNFKQLSQIQNLNDELGRISSETSQLKTTQSIEQQTAAMISQQNKTLLDSTQRAEKLEKEIAELRKKLDDYKRAYNEQKANLQKATADVEKLKNPSAAPQTNEKELQEKYEHAKLKIKKLEDQKRELEKKVGPLEAKISEQQSNIDALYQEVQQVYESQEQSVSEQTKLAAQVKSLTEKVGLLQNQEMTIKLELQMKTSDLEKQETRSRIQDEQLVDLRDRQKLDSDIVESQKAMISNLEKIHQAQQEALHDAIQEMNEAIKKEKASTDRALQMQKVIDDLSQKLMIVSTESDQYQIKLQEIRKNPYNQLQGSGPATCDENDILFLRMKAKKYDSRMKCPCCNTREKQVILPCLHMYCDECIQNQLQARNRCCPVDRQKFQSSDVKKIIWGESDV